MTEVERMILKNQELIMRMIDTMMYPKYSNELITQIRVVQDYLKENEDSK